LGGTTDFYLGSNIENLKDASEFDTRNHRKEWNKVIEKANVYENE
jgi:membrane protein YqaA with SNARE-associated domain